MKNNLKLKRILSSLIDFVIMLLLFLFVGFIYSCIFIENNQDYQNNVVEMNSILSSSGLYKQEKDQLVDIDSNYDQHISEFYQMKYDGEHTFPYVDKLDYYTSYEDAKDKSGLFNKVNDVYYPLIDKEDSEFINFYKRELYKAQISLYNYTNYKNLDKEVNRVLKIGGYVSIVSSNLIVYFIMPFILKKGRTIGDLIFKLKLVSQDGNKPSFAQLIIRFIAWMMIDILMSTWLLLIPITINIIICLCDKKSRGIADLLAVTMLQEDLDEKKRR